MNQLSFATDAQSKTRMFGYLPLDPLHSPDRRARVDVSGVVGAQGEHPAPPKAHTHQLAGYLLGIGLTGQRLDDRPRP